MSDFILDDSLTLQWFLEDEADRKYSLAVLASLSEKRALVPMLGLKRTTKRAFHTWCRTRIMSV